MSRLAQINTYAETTVAQLYGNTSVEDIRMHFSLVNRRVEQMLLDIERAENLDYLQHTSIVTQETVTVLRDAIKCILDNTDTMVTDLNMINDSGIHSIENFSHLSYVASEIIERADELHKGKGWVNWLKSRFTKTGHFQKSLIEASKIEQPKLEPMLTYEPIDRQVA